MNMLDKARRESIRWHLLMTLNSARPIGTNEAVVLSIMRELYPDLTQREMRVELDYLEERKLIDIERQRSPQWFAKISRTGIDIVEYTVDCEPGIARPDRYWP